MPSPECVKAAGRTVITILGYDLVCTRLAILPTGTVQYYVQFQANGESTYPFNCTVHPSQFPAAVPASRYRLLRREDNRTDSEDDLDMRDN